MKKMKITAIVFLVAIALMLLFTGAAGALLVFHELNAETLKTYKLCINGFVASAFVALVMIAIFKKNDYHTTSVFAHLKAK